MTLRIDVWSDIACPWCYVGKRRLEEALNAFAHKDEVELVWRAFELDSSAPKVFSEQPSYTERLAKKYGKTPAEGEAMCHRMTNVAALDGLSFRFDIIRGGNTFDAHRLLHLALEEGCQDALKERFFAAYLQEGKAIGDVEVLAALAGEVGLDATRVDEVLAGVDYAAQVREDQAIARSLKISGVPFFVLDRRVGVSGAQPADVLRGALESAWAQQQPLEAQTSSEVCGPAGCAV